MRRVTYEVPSHVHDDTPGLVTYERSVEVFHCDHVARFDVPKWLNPRGHFVYMVWGENVVEENGEDRDILYIGMTGRILMRLAQHANDSEWWHYADHIDVFQYATRQAALEVEQWMITRYGPLYNVHYSQPSQPTRLVETLEG